QDLVEQHRDSMLAVELDVTDAEEAETALRAGVDRFGRIDVVVNNAGYANLAPIESAEPADFRTQFETNFWGVYNVSKAAIPVLRAEGGGLVVQFFSICGRVCGNAWLGFYQ